jgi:hypothetical protein
MAKKFNRWEYLVVGKGAFPIDMLRYDNCWPATADDSAMIPLSSRSDYGTSPRDAIPIKLRGLLPPTEARWNSFGWRVFEVRGYKI